MPLQVMPRTPNLPGEGGQPQSPTGNDADEFWKNLDLDNDESKKEDNAGVKKARNLTIKGKTADDDQRKVMELAISTASEQKGVTDKSILALICAIIQESLAVNLKGGDGTSSGILQVTASTGVSHHVDPRDIEAVVKEFMKNGYTGKGGAIALSKQKSPQLSVGQIAQACQGSAYPDRYQGHLEEARKWLAAAKGGRIDGGGGSYKKSYQYKRERGENSWDCIQRLANEVEWRCFPLGKALYYMSETDLYQRRVAYTLTPDDPSIIDFTYDIDWRKKTPTNEGTLTVTLDRWGAPPGYVVMLDGWGPPDGRWLIISIHRDWFSPIAEVTIRQPIIPNLEPAAEIKEHGAEGGEADTGSGIKLYRECRRISDAGGGYSYGGGHGKPLSQLHSGDGLDCSSSTSLALYRAKLWDHAAVARTSGMFNDWGRSGRGDIFTVCYSNDHVYIRFESGASVDKKRFDTSPWGDTSGSGPRLRSTQGRPNDDGMKLRHWPDM